MTTPRVLRIEHVPGRPEMNGPAHAYGSEGWALMTRLVYAGLALAGEPATVDRTVSRVLRAPARGPDVARGEPR